MVRVVGVRADDDSVAARFSLACSRFQAGESGIERRPSREALVSSQSKLQANVEHSLPKVGLSARARDRQDGITLPSIDVDPDQIAAPQHQLDLVSAQALGNAQDCGELDRRTPRCRRQIDDLLVGALGRRAAMKPRDGGDHLDLFGGEAIQAAIADQVIRVLVMLPLSDRAAHFVQQSRKLQELSIASAELVESLGRVEQSDGLASHLASMELVVAQATAQRLDAASSESGVRRRHCRRQLGNFGGPRREPVGVCPL